MDLSIREIQTDDVRHIVDYWLHSDREHLQKMGVDVSKIPTEEQLFRNISANIDKPYEEKLAYCLIWLLDGIPVGHSNTNPTNFGKDAFMHLHLWKLETRHKGIGAKFLQLTIAAFFEKLQLQDLYCQPYALNPAPHKALEKAGFEFVKEYHTIPGTINSEQPVKLWHFSKERFNQLKDQK